MLTNQTFLNMARTYPLLALLALLALALTHVQATLSVYNSQALGESNSELLDIPYSIANFGFVPFGKTIIARLMHSPNFSSECSIDPNQHSNYENSFLLIPRGECEFVTKALTAQKLGAQMAIIMDDKEHQRLVIMTDNGYGYKVKIPSIFINHKKGKLLQDLLDNNPTSSVMVKITFENKKTDKAAVTFWLQANNRHSYRLVEDFRKYYPLIKDQTDFSLVYSNIDCGFVCKKEDCYNDRAFCAKNLIHEQSATGRDILDQQIREEIAFELYPDTWWKFMKSFDEECSVIAAYKECGFAIMKSNGMDVATIETAYKKSFNGEQNSYLKKNRDILQNSGITNFPSVTINGVKIKGSLYAEFIFDDICNTLTAPPASCTKYIQTETQISEVTNEWSTLLLVIVIGVLIFSAIFVAYRRYMKKRISFEMQGRVDDMVSKYIEFYSERSGQNNR